MPLPETVRRIADLALSVVAGAVIAVVAIFFWSDTNDPQVSAALHNIGAGQNTTSEIRAISDSLEAERRDLKMLSDQFLALASRLSAVQENTTLILRNNAELAERLKTTQTQIAQDNALVAEQLKATKAGTEASQLKKTADAGSADLRKSLQQERDRAGRLEQDLAAARRDVETQTALATKAGTEASQLKKTADAGVADLQKSLQQERDRAAQLEQDLAAARRDVETQTALAAKAGAEASQLKKTADGAAEWRRSLEQEWERAARRERDLAAARRDVEKQTALAAKAGDEASQLKQAAESTSAELRKSLQQERDRAAQVERDLASALTQKNVPPQSIPTSGQVTLREAEAAKPAAAEQAALLNARADAQPKVEDAEVARLVVRARALIGRGDIGSARIVLQRAADAGNALACYTLAETYDPLMLSKWGTYGTRSDATKALDLYAKAQAGGIKEAKERLDALRR
jgi:hypothetical protein